MRTFAAVLCVSALFAIPAKADFVNGGFETGSFAGWIVNDNPTPFFPLTVATLGSDNSFGWSWDSTPTEGDFAAYHGFDGQAGAISLAQDLSVTGTILEFDFRHAWDLANFGATLDRSFEVIVEDFGGGAVLQSDTILVADAGTFVDDTGSQSAAVDVSSFTGSSVRIIFQWNIPKDFSGPAAGQLDNVRIAGIPEPTSVMLLGIAGAFLVLRRRHE